MIKIHLTPGITVMRENHRIWLITSWTESILSVDQAKELARALNPESPLVWGEDD